MSCLYLVYVLLLTLLRDSHGLIRSQVIQNASVGNTVVLPCEDTLHATSLVWRRKEQIISDGRTIGSHFDGNERMKITGDFSVGEYNLQITNISKRDSDTYTCEAAINKTTHQREVVLTIQDAIEVTTMFEKYSETTVIIGSTSSSTTTTTITTTTKEHFTPNDNNNLVREENEFLKYALIAVGSISVLALSIACSMCLYKCLTHRTKNHLNITAKTENVVEQSNNIVDLADEENLNEYELIHEDAMENIRQIYSYATNDSAPHHGNSEHPLYLDIVEENRFSTNFYQPAVDIDPAERHNYEKPMQEEMDKTVGQVDATVVKELHNIDETSKELTIPKQQVQTTDTTQF